MNVLLLRFEDLLENTAECVHVLRSGLRLLPSEHFAIPASPSKSHGAPSGYIHARLRLADPQPFSDDDGYAISRQLAKEFCYEMHYEPIFDGAFI
jgi:hypothetical protein